MLRLEWEDAAACFNVLATESRWSQAFYAYGMHELTFELGFDSFDSYCALSISVLLACSVCTYTMLEFVDFTSIFTKIPIQTMNVYENLVCFFLRRTIIGCTKVHLRVWVVI